MSVTQDPSSAGRRITMAEAREMVETYAKACTDTDIRSLTINADYLRKILDQPDCQFVRFYLAVVDPKAQAQGLPQGHSLVVIGADSTNANITLDDDATQVYEDLSICPPGCDGDSYTL
ncbi:hypothetical protein [Mucilaginibacter agri]|uniref:Uncharacterized protein n=1 Tax=Mucilaginibacter agri TaxID=2695265 RepID=A0A966DRQ3_9SPHI|nr:hypothetical protein [Mucilaginibacter agri]NCD69338.1 hypothetical protein [Mucilaginibacter agri]